MEDSVRVLYIDDSLLDRELVRDALLHAEQRFDLSEAATRSDFEAELLHGPFDIVLTDFNILGFDGLQVLDRVRRLWPEVPVIVVTGTGSEEIAVTAMKRGAADYIIKTPQSVARLPMAMRSVLQTARLRREQAAADQELRESERRLNHAQKMESVGRLAGGVAHDFNNMLQVIGGYATLARQDQSLSQQVQLWLDTILEATERSADLTRQLLAFARIQPVEPQAINLEKALSDITRMLKRLVGEQIELRCQPAADTWPIRMDPSQLNSAIANLIVNSRDAMQDGGTITVETQNRTVAAAVSQQYDAQAGEYVAISVRDSGDGIDPDVLEHVFEPFFTTKQPGLGTGLGLSTVYGVVSQNNGFVTIDSQAGAGTEFCLFLPRYNAENEPRTQAPATQAADTQRIILLVEDDQQVLEVISRLLRRLGYTVVSTGSAAHALELVNEGLDDLALVITDVIMPEINGRELVDRIQETIPAVPVLFTSGYPADVIGKHGVIASEVHFLPKPFDLDKLGGKIREVLEGEEDVAG